MAQQEQLIAVVGATGLQGGETIKALQKLGGFTVRGLTRNTDSAAAKALKDSNVEVVQADLNDKASLLQAFTGAHGVFLVTNTHSTGGSATLEFAHGKNAADAAVETGVKHLVFSSLEDPRGHLPADMPELVDQPGRYVPVFEVKAEIEAYIRTLPIHATHLLTTAYYENFIRWYHYQKHADGSLTLGTNAGFQPWSMQCVADIGATAAAIFQRGTSLPNNEVVPIVGEDISLPDALKVLSEVTGRKVTYKFVDDAGMRSLPIIWSRGDVPEEQRISWAQSASNLYQLFRECQPWRAELRPQSKQLVPGTSFREWALRNKAALAANVDAATDSPVPFGFQ